MKIYTLEAGRCIVRDGVPIATIHGVRNYDPCELDQLARDIIPAINSHAALVEALEAMVNAYAPFADASVAQQGEQCLHSSVKKARAALTLTKGA